MMYLLGIMLWGSVVKYANLPKKKKKERNVEPDLRHYMYLLTCIR